MGEIYGVVHKFLALLCERIQGFCVNIAMMKVSQI